MVMAVCTSCKSYVRITVPKHQTWNGVINSVITPVQHPLPVEEDALAVVAGVQHAPRQQLAAPAADVHNDLFGPK